MNLIKRLFVCKPLTKLSKIEMFLGESYEVNRWHQSLSRNHNIHITSVSITRVDNLGSRGYVDCYMMAVSYDYYTTE